MPQEFAPSVIAPANPVNTKDLVHTDDLSGIELLSSCYPMSWTILLDFFAT